MISARLKLVLLVVCVVEIITAGYFFLLRPQTDTGTQKLVPEKSENPPLAAEFGWTFPASYLAIADIPGAPPPLFDVEINPGKYLAYSDIRDPGGVPQGLPVRLKIPAIGVNAVIEDAYITSDGRMDVPAGTINVAWFALGTYPGSVGSAVIGGHYGNYEDNKGPTVFYYLDQLKPGDKVYVEDDSGNTFAFVVKRVQLFDRNADSASVFTSGDGLSHLNLITCEGVWNQVNDSYPDRRVVFTDAIPTEGAVNVTQTDTASVVTPLSPTVAPTGETSIIPSNAPKDGKIIAQTGVKRPTPFHEIPIQYLKSLYQTPVDGIITSFLLISIGFVALKISGNNTSILWNWSFRRKT